MRSCEQSEQCEQRVASCGSALTGVRHARHDGKQSRRGGSNYNSVKCPIGEHHDNLRATPWWGHFGGVVATTMIERLNTSLQITLLRLELCRVRLVSGLARSLVLSAAALSVFFRLGIQLTLTQEIARFCALPILFIVCRLRTLDDLCAMSNEPKQAPRRYWLLGEGRRTILPTMES